MAKEKFTAPRVAAFECPPDKQQAFLWDSEVPGLGLRATAAGSKAYVFEGLLHGRSLRITIGSPDVWQLESVSVRDPATGATVRTMGARERARELRRQLDQGIDPRAVKAEKAAADEAKREEERRASVRVCDVWPVYMAEGKPRGKDAWKPRYRSDLERAAALGGLKKKRGEGLTKPGHLAPLMPLRLASITGDTIREWYGSERKRAPIQAARAMAMFSGFLNWCATRPQFRDLVDRDAARASELRDVLPQKRRRTDALSIEQLEPWFEGTTRIRSAPARAYLQALVLTGARREEMAGLRWADVDFRWKTLRLADKVGETRTIPLSPYMAELLGALPRARLRDGKANPYVFSSTSSASGRISEPRSPHDALLEAAGIPHVSIHGLRRTFALLGEAAGAPAGAIAQVMGHRPSAVAEGYKPRTVDALRPYLEQIESFVLERGKVPWQPGSTAKSLRLVGNP